MGKNDFSLILIAASDNDYDEGEVEEDKNTNEITVTAIKKMVMMATTIRYEMTMMTTKISMRIEQIRLQRC